MKKSLVIMVIALLLMPLSAIAMDALTSKDLNSVAGQSGVTLGFCGRSTTTVSFSKLSWGDPGGYGTCGNSRGWLIISGMVTVSQAIADGQTMTLDIGRTSSTTCDACGANGAVIVPANTTFIALDLPTISTTITVANTLYIGLGTVGGTISQTLGVLNLAGLSVTQGTPGILLIWAH